jgi:RNA polymerase sigma-70 factor (ECF subfamily)
MRRLSQSHLREDQNPTIQIAIDPLYPKTSGSCGFAAAGYAGVIRSSASRATGTRAPDIRKRQPGDPAGTDASDEALITAIGRGDRHAMALLYGRHHLKVYRFALRITSDPASAEDVVSDVFLDVWRRAGAFKARAQVSTWLLAIARNKSLSALRRASAEHLDCETIEVSDPSDNPELLMHKKGRSEVIRKCLSRLSAVQREVIDLVYYHEKSVAEVARIVGVPANTVKTRMFHARQRIGALLHAAGHGDL